MIVSWLLIVSWLQPPDSQWWILPPCGPGALRRHVSALTTIPTSFDEHSHPCHLLCLSDRPWPWAEEFQRIDTHLPNAQPFHIFVTFFQSEDSLHKRDQCFRTWNMLAESGCYVWQLLSIPCHPCLISPCPVLQCPSVSAVTEQRQSPGKPQPLRLRSLSTFSACRHRTSKWVSTVIRAI